MSCHSDEDANDNAEEQRLAEDTELTLESFRVDVET